MCRCCAPISEGSAQHGDRSVSSLSTINSSGEEYIHGNILQDRVVQNGKRVGENCGVGVDEGDRKVHTDFINLNGDQRDVATGQTGTWGERERDRSDAYDSRFLGEERVKGREVVLLRNGARNNAESTDNGEESPGQVNIGGSGADAECKRAVQENVALRIVHDLLVISLRYTPSLWHTMSLNTERIHVFSKPFRYSIMLCLCSMSFSSSSSLLILDRIACHLGVRKQLTQLAFDLRFCCQCLTRVHVSVN